MVVRYKSSEISRALLENSCQMENHTSIFRMEIRNIGKHLELPTVLLIAIGTTQKQEGKAMKLRKGINSSSMVSIVCSANR